MHRLNRYVNTGVLLNIGFVQNIKLTVFHENIFLDISLTAVKFPNNFSGFQVF